MSHQIHTTNALVLGSRNVGEANRLITLLCEDLGLVRAVAQGVRLSKSKLKSSLYIFAEVEASLVRGRDIWRLVGAQERYRPNVVLGSPARGALLARICTFIGRFVQGEEQDLQLYAEVRSIVALLERSEVNEDQYPYIESMAVARLLNLLGYFKENERFFPLLEEPWGSERAVKVARDHHRELVAVINKTLSETQL